MTTKSENISIRLQPDVRAQIERLAKTQRRSRNFVINEALGQYVAGETDKQLVATRKKNLGIGAWKDQLIIHPTFNDDMTPEEISLWQDGPIEPAR